MLDIRLVDPAVGCTKSPQGGQVTFTVFDAIFAIISDPASSGIDHLICSAGNELNIRSVFGDGMDLLLETGNRVGRTSSLVVSQSREKNKSLLK